MYKHGRGQSAPPLEGDDLPLLLGEEDLLPPEEDDLLLLLD